MPSFRAIVFLATAVSLCIHGLGQCQDQSTAGSLLIQHVSNLQPGRLHSTKDEHDFTIVFIPDTQFMVMDNGYSGAFLRQWLDQADWVIREKASLNIKAVIHVGDLVEEAHRAHEWNNFFQGWEKIEAAGIPWSVVPGNHDLKSMGCWNCDDRWDDYNRFMEPAFKRNAALDSNFPAGKYENSVVFFEAGGMEFMIVGIELGPRQSSLDWASEQLKKFPQKHAIINNHFVLWGAETGIDIKGWAKQHRNIFLLQQGHDCAREWNKVFYNDWGEPIQEVLTDYQCSGDAFLRYYTFRVGLNRVDAYTYSPSLGRYETDSNSQWNFEFQMIPGDPALPSPSTGGSQTPVCYSFLFGVPSYEGNSVGGDLTNSPVLADCKRACDGNAQCNSFAFCPGYNGCWLKDRIFVGDEATITNGDCKMYYKTLCDAATTRSSTATVTTVTTTIDSGSSTGSAQSSFRPVDGGNDRACRGSIVSDNSDDYYNVLFGTLSQEACMLECLKEPDCKGIEYHSNGRCEVWVRPEGIEASAPVAGYTCLAYGQQSSTTALVTPMPFQPVDGGSDRACRGSSASDNSNAYYSAFFGVRSQEGCMLECLKEPDCKGIEYHSNGRCEVWVRPEGIEASSPVAGYTCLSYGQQVRPTSSPISSTSPGSTTATTTAESPTATSTAMPTCAMFDLWPNIDGGITCQQCTALVLTAPYGGRCDRYCESFGHVCIAAAEEQNENCQVKEMKQCSEEIQDTSDMLCTCWQDPAQPPPTTPPAGSSVKVVSYNLYWWNAFGQNPGNGQRICDNIKYTLTPDVIGVQECDSPDLINSRTDYVRTSEFAGGQGVMALPGLFTTGESGSRDLQATGKWGPRYVTWSELTHNPSGRSFWIFNTHWCVHSGNGQTCSADKRYTGAKNMLEVIRERAGNAPVLITGDFNAAMSEAGPQHFLQNGFSLAVNNWVDSIFYSTEHWRVTDAWTGNSAGSDHSPVVAKLVFM